MDTVVQSTTRRRLLVPVLALLAVLVALVAVTSTGAMAANGVDRAANALQHGPVYVDPRASDQLTDGQAHDLTGTIKDADKPVFVAVLPAGADFRPNTLFQDLRTEVGISGVYAVALGDRFDARADSSVMSHDAVTHLVGAVQRGNSGDVQAMVTDFVDHAVQQANGDAPASWNGGPVNGDNGSNAGVLTGFGVILGLLALVVGGALFVGRRRNRRLREEEARQLEALRPVVDEDITAYGEKLDRLDFSPSEAGADDAMRADWTHALDSYDQAKEAMAAARHPRDVQAVTKALEDGRFALATLEARRSGEPLPERRPPCFFDPRHGPSVTDAQWAPPGGATRTVPVCAADATRIADGVEPLSREVDTAQGRRPYWDAGPMYGPWAYGYFGGGMLPGLLTGTLLGSMMAGPYGWGGYGFDGFGGGTEGGDFTGGDFGGGDFGGGFGDGGFGGGGDFGGGFGGGS
jgi:hypothetical protein